jgi:hypothetical protein
MENIEVFLKSGQIIPNSFQDLKVSISTLSFPKSSWVHHLTGTLRLEELNPT